MLLALVFFWRVFQPLGARKVTCWVSHMVGHVHMFLGTEGSLCGLVQKWGV